MKKATLYGDYEIRVQFKSSDSGEFNALLSVIKEVPGRRYLHIEKLWTIPVNKENIALLISMDFMLCDELRKIKIQES